MIKFVYFSLLINYQTYSDSARQFSSICRSECYRNDRIIIPVTLYAVGIEGWPTTFYTLHSTNQTYSSAINGDLASLPENIKEWKNTAISSDFVDLGTQRETHICVSAKPMCYLARIIQLLISQLT